jgi:hypothetical protein
MVSGRPLFAVAVMFCCLSMSSVVAAYSPQPPSVNGRQALAAYSALCTPGGLIATGIFAVSQGAYFVDYYHGGIYFCNQGATYQVALPPPNEERGQDDAYWGLAGVNTKTYGLVLAAMDNEGGFYFCIGADPEGCAIESDFNILTSTFCTLQPAGICNPVGIAMDKKLNIYYADPVNADVVECTFASHYTGCIQLETLSDFPTSIAFDPSGNIWISDNGCSGNVWKNGALQYSLEDSLGAVVWSKSNPTHAAHLYLAISATCGFYSFAGVYDVTDHTFLTTPFSTGETIYGLSTHLQLTWGSAGDPVYQLKDRA